MKLKMNTNAIGLIFLFLGLLAIAIYYFYPRGVKFTLSKTIDFPIKKIEVGYPYNYISQENIFEYVFLINREYDSLFVDSLGKMLNFLEYDYIVTYGKELRDLSYSPYLKKFKDGCTSIEGMPLIPNYLPYATNKVYIYQIKKNPKLRGGCG